MQVILLPRADRSNKRWLEELGFSLHDIVHSISLHHYDHWYTSDEVGLDREIASVKKTISRESVLIGTELGAFIALNAAVSPTTKPAACILIDPPLEWALIRKLPLVSLLSSTKVPSLLIQSKSPSSKIKQNLKPSRYVTHTIVKTPDAIEKKVRSFIASL